MLKLLLLLWAAAANAFPLQTTTSVNISDAWLLTDSESPVFYRHFRDKVTWEEAESVCQFHHSVLATVRNTAEFDRTRALLRQLEWTTPVWVGLRRSDGQPMFKWSTPAGATLEASEGYWHDSPNAVTAKPQCVTIDPAADFRWKAVDCTNALEIHSFLCQIPVPVWVRAERGGCLSPKWPNKEVTVQYIPQTRALEMTADCGLRGTRRIACKHNSEKDLYKMEQKLQCEAHVEVVAAPAPPPPRPVTRHRRDVDAADAPSTAPPTAGLPIETSSPSTGPPAEVSTGATVSSTVVEVTTSTTEAASTPKSVSTEAVPTTKDTITTTAPLETSSLSATTTEIILPTEVPTQKAKTETPTTMAPVEMTTSAAPPPRMNVEIIAHIFDTSTDGTAINRVFTIEDVQTELQEHATRPSGQQEEADEQMQNTQPLVIVAKHHQQQHEVVPGVPRIVAPSHSDSPHHPMALPLPHHNITPGVPRIVAVPPPHSGPQPPFLIHPMVHVDGHPRIEETRSAEDHVALRRKQFLPTPLQGPAVEVHHHVPMMYHQQPLEQTSTIASQQQTHSEEEDSEFEDEEPEALHAAKEAVRSEHQSTEDILNAETDEELVAAENRLKGRRNEEKPRERHLARSLYPFILNRLLG